MEKKHTHALKLRTYIFIWVALIELTILSVAAATVDFKAFAVAVALVIAIAKSLIVGAYFMHLKLRYDEDRYNLKKHNLFLFKIQSKIGCYYHS